jgi:hypothetical protein
MRRAAIPAPEIFRRAFVLDVLQRDPKQGIAMLVQPSFRVGGNGNIRELHDTGSA